MSHDDIAEWTPIKFYILRDGQVLFGFIDSAAFEQAEHEIQAANFLDIEALQAVSLGDGTDFETSGMDPVAAQSNIVGQVVAIDEPDQRVMLSVNSNDGFESRQVFRSGDYSTMDKDSISSHCARSLVCRTRCAARGSP